MVMMLLDVNGFWQYDNRESLMQQHGSGDDQAEQDAVEREYEGQGVEDTSAGEARADNWGDAQEDFW